MQIQPKYILRCIFSFGPDVGFMSLDDLLSINFCHLMQRCDVINLGVEIEYKGLRGRRLLSFSPLTCPRDFLPSPK